MEVAVLGVLPALPSLECRAVCTAMPTPLNYADGLMQRSQLVAARSEAERPVQAAYLVQAQHGQQQAGDTRASGMAVRERAGHKPPITRRKVKAEGGFNSGSRARPCLQWPTHPPSPTQHP